MSIQELAGEISRQNEVKEDYAVSSQLMSVSSNGHTDLRVGDAGVFSVNQLAHRQLSSWLGIDAGYYDLLKANTDRLTVDLSRRAAAPLFDATLNAFFRNRPEGERRLIRTLDGTARAVLSDSYRMLDNADIAAYVLPLLMEMSDIDWEHSSMQVTDTNLYVKVVSKTIQGQVKVGDIVSAGVIIQNSEVGKGALSVVPLSFRLWCDNGATHNVFGTRKYHAGSKLGGGDDGKNFDLGDRFFKDDTLKARDQALMLELRDIVSGAMSEATLGKIIEQMQTAEGIEIKPSIAPNVVENVTKRFRLSQDEGRSLLDAFLEGPSLQRASYSLGGLANAVTLMAQGVEDYDRSTELEEIGGKLFAMPRHEIGEMLSSARANHDARN